MKTTILIISILVPLIAFSQNNWGIYFNYNLTTQTNFEPTRPQDGISMHNWQKSISPGVFYDIKISNKLSNRFTLFYNKKGFNQYIQNGSFGDPNLYNSVHKSKFDFLSIQHNLKYLIGGKRPEYTLHSFIGYELSYLLRYVIGRRSQQIVHTDYFISRTYYPFNQYIDIKKLSVAGQIGLGIGMKNIMEINIFHSRDISRFINTSTLIARNWSFNFQLLVNIGQIIIDESK